ncbi:MAG TPA: hypothetical protein VH641_19340 [Streptosporangiaceae bacterium]
MRRPDTATRQAARPRATETAQGTTHLLRRHWLLAALLLAGLVLRVLTLVAYRPILFYNDSTRYLLFADGNDPIAYRLPLRLILFAGNLQVVSAVQHLLGLAIAVTLYVMLLRRGCPRWLAALACAPVLLDAYQLQIEQTMLPEVWFEALIVAALVVLLWRPRPGLLSIGLAGAVLGVAVTFRQPGEILIVPAVIFVLITGQGVRRKLAGAALVCVAFVVPILGYMTASEVITGHFWLSRYGTAALYGRAASAADCAALRVPASQRAMCPTAKQKATLGRDGLEHSSQSPIRRYYATLPPAQAAHEVSSFTRSVITQQPLRVLSAIGTDAVKLFALTRNGSPGDPAISRWQFQLTFPTYSPHATHLQEVAAISEFGGGGPAVTTGVAGFLRAYQLHGGYTPGPVYAVTALAALAGSLTPLWRRRETGRAAQVTREQALAALLFLLTAVSVLLISDVFEFSWRYQLPAVVTLPPAGAFGIAALMGMWSARAKPQRPGARKSR